MQFARFGIRLIQSKIIANPITAGLLVGSVYAFVKYLKHLEHKNFPEKSGMNRINKTNLNDNNTESKKIFVKKMTGKKNLKDPMSIPDFRGQTTGPCPLCGYEYVTGRQSKKTGELYFGCAAPKINNTKGCNFKGSRSH